MQLGCNYSEPLIQLLDAGRVDVDWIKIGMLQTLDQDLKVARARRPVLIHHLPFLGAKSSEIEQFPWAFVSEQLQKAGAPHTAAHAEIRPSDWPGSVDLRFQDRSVARGVINRFLQNTRTMAARLPVPLHIENVPYYGFRGTFRVACQPETLWELVEQAGVCLLLDLSHMRCTAYHLGINVKAYARALPLNTVSEIHVSGVRNNPGEGLRDLHYSLRVEDYDLIEWLLGETRAEILTLEYGGVGEKFEIPERNDIDELELQLNTLRYRLMG